VTELKTIYPSITVSGAEKVLEAFTEVWDSKYPSISQSWHNQWPSNLIAFFDYPDEIWKIIYTTNALESVNRLISKATNARKIFPSNQICNESNLSGYRERFKKMVYAIK